MICGWKSCCALCLAQPQNCPTKRHLSGLQSYCRVIDFLLAAALSLLCLRGLKILGNGAEALQCKLQTILLELMKWRRLLKLPQRHPWFQLCQRRLAV